MARQYKVLCKRCQQHYIEYSEESYLRMLDRGHSRPQYCGEEGNNCRERHRAEKSSAAVSYFHLIPVKGRSSAEIESGGLGSIQHPEREHVLTEIPSNFDKDKFGITPDNIREIYEWFQDPEHRVVIVEGPTGSGKSTALPYWLLEPPEGIPSDFFTRDGQILITEPRIVATEGVAGFIAGELLGSGLGKGHEIGYRHSKDRNRDWRNRAFPTTDGSLINMIQKGELGNLSVIMIDEAHERSQNIDVILRLLKSQLPLYPHLRLIIASATIDAPKFAEYYGHDTAKVISLEGKRKFGYEVFYQPEDQELPYGDIDRLQNVVIKETAEKVLWLLDQIADGTKEHGDILAFLHGTKEIDEALARIQQAVDGDDRLTELVQLYPLHASLPKKETDVVSQKGDDSTVRVIVSTNVAEASVTVEGVVYVVESGLEKQAHWNKGTLTTEIVTVLTSQANARQRWGRSGRTRPGEVHCLYTEGQFENLMPEYPIPDIQRLSMENVILDSKAAGIDDIESDWLDAPDGEEVERASLMLQKEGAVDGDGVLTEYGYLLRFFPYTKELSDLIMLADRFGCVIEVATLLPIVKNGGQRRVLQWNWDWDAYTKREVAQIHRALMRGCHDDIEFLLKLYSLWRNPPVTGQSSNGNQKLVRKAWSRANFVNHKVFEEIEEEKNSILEKLYGHRKVKDYRKVDLKLVDRVRLLLAYALPQQREKGVNAPETGYVFDPKMEPELGSSATYKAVLLPEWKIGLDTLGKGEHTHARLSTLLKDWEVQASRKYRVKYAESRLFLDQKFPVGSRYECTVMGIDDDHAEVRVDRLLHEKQEVEEVYRLSQEEDEFDLETEEGEDFEEIELEVSLDRYDELTYKAVLEIEDKDDLEEGDAVEAEVTDYDFSKVTQPTVVVSLIPDPRPLDLFVEKYEEYDEVVVEVVGYEEYPGDYRPALVVKEVETGFEALMEPEHISSTYTPYLVREFDPGFTFEVMVEEIDEEQERVYLSLLPLALERLREILEDQKGKGKTYRVMGEVVDVREDGKVFLQLEWSEPEKGFYYLVLLSRRYLFKPIEEFAVGETYKVFIHANGNREFFARLPELPRKLESQLGWDDGKLFWENGTLKFQGSMTHDELFEFKSLHKDKNYRRALEKLYWYSNRIWVSHVEDAGWAKQLEEEYPKGTKLEGLEVKAVKDFGLFVRLDDEVEGFVPRSMTYNAEYDSLEPGDQIEAVVTDINEEKLSVVLDMRLEDGTERVEQLKGQYPKGTKLEGLEVKAVKDFGLFVRLQDTEVDGFVPRPLSYESHFSTLEAGDRVDAVVSEINEEKEGVVLDMRLPDYDPISQYEADQEVKGVVQGVKEYGAFVELVSGFTALAHKSNISGGVSDAREHLKPGDKVSAKILSIDADKRRMSLLIEEV